MGVSPGLPPSLPRREPGWEAAGDGDGVVAEDKDGACPVLFTWGKKKKKKEERKEDKEKVRRKEGREKLPK